MKNSSSKYGKMTPSWFKNPEGNWLTKYQDAGEVIYVDDPNDPRLLDYQTRLNLYNYGQLPNLYHRDKIGIEDILSGKYDQENIKERLDRPYLSNAYNTHEYGPYGSKNEIRDISINDLNTFINNPELADPANIHYAFNSELGKDILKQYPPSSYKGLYEYGEQPFRSQAPNRGRQFFGTDKYFTAPQTQFIEDNIDRELLRKTYPNLTDEIIDEYVQKERENPTYYTNRWDPGYSWYNFASVDSPTITPETTTNEGINMIDTVNGLYPKTYNINYTDRVTQETAKKPIKGYLQEGIGYDIDRYGTYYPVWDAPTQKVELRKPQPAPPKPDRAVIQVGDSPYEKGSRKSYKAVQDKYPGMGTHEYADQVRVGSDLYPVTHTGDQSYGEFEIDGKKQYVTYEKNPEGGYSPVISENKPATPKVVKAPTFKSGGWLDQYQKGSQVKTYESDPSYFDNRAIYHDDSRFNDLIRSKVYAGTHGWDPTTNSLVKLDKPVAVPKSVQEMSTADWGKKSHQERVESKTPAGKATRKAIVAKEMNKAVTNPGFRGAIPAMMLPGLPALGEAVHAGLMSTPIGSATAGALGSSIAPGLTYGTLGQGLMDSYFAAKAPGQLMNANLNFKSGNTLEGIGNLGLGAMNLLPFAPYIPKRAPGPLMISDDFSKGVSKAKGDEPHLSEWQKLRIAEGKPVYTGSGQKGNMTMGEMSAKKQLNKSIDAREKPKKVKKLTKEQEYEKLLRESYQKYGGVKSSGEGYYDYINGYSGIFAKGGTKGWLDNYK